MPEGASSTPVLPKSKQEEDIISIINMETYVGYFIKSQQCIGFKS